MNKTDFLKALFEGEKDYIEIREISQEGQTKQFFFKFNELLEYVPPKDKNVYFGLYGRRIEKGNAESCTTTRVLWADYDHTNKAEVLKRIKEAGLPDPSILVNSGNGIHSYWLLDKPAGNEAVLSVKAIAIQTGADQNATDKARILRLPDTFNVKAEAKLCKVLDHNSNIYSLREFPAIEEGEKQAFKSFYKGPLNFDRPCIEAMFKGVPAGERNFALGRITKYLQQKGTARKQVFSEVLQWNKRCDPPENEARVISSFNAYWKTGYKLLGCSLEDIEKQTILCKYCDKSNCKVQALIGRLNLNQSVGYNNRLFNYIGQISGQELVIYGLLLKYPQGLSNRQLAGFKGKAMSNRRMIAALESLEKKDFVLISGNLKRQGKKQQFFVKAKPQGTFGTGYTPVNNGAIIGVVSKFIKPSEYKLYLLLLKYAFGKGSCYPSQNTLARALKIDQSVISKGLKELEAKGYIFRHYINNSVTTELLI